MLFNLLKIKHFNCPFPAVPGGRVPVLMVDDKSILQSLTIARYAARQAGLVPQDNLEAALCDEVVDTVSEILSEVYQHL